MQDTGAGTADKFKIMGDNENDLSQLRQPPDQSRHLRHAVKVQAAGGLVEHQQVFSADHADSYGHPLLLPAGQRVGVALPIGSQPQFLQSRGGQGQVRIADAERALRLHTLGK